MKVGGIILEYESLYKESYPPSEASTSRPKLSLLMALLKVSDERVYIPKTA